MYRDVKKKLLSVALCVCMIIGMVQVVPKAEAANLLGDGKTVEIKGKNPQGYEETCKLIIESSKLSYTGAQQVPKVSYANDSKGNKISGSENWNLILADGDGETVGTNHKCCLPTGTTDSGYYFESADTTFPYEITTATITDYTITQSSRVVPWQSGGVKPAVSSVKVRLNGKVDLTLDPSQYELTPNLGPGNASSYITIKNTNIAGSIPDPINYIIAYPLNGCLEDGTTQREMRIEADSENYDGTVHTPNIRIKDSGGWTTDIKDNNADFVNNFTVKYFKKNIQGNYEGIGASDICDAGTYKVQVTANDGCALLGSYYYTGTFEGIYTITAKENTGLYVVADDVANNKKGVTIYENSALKTELVYQYADGKPVTLQNVQVWDGTKEVTSQFEKKYSGETGVGNASLTLEPIKNQSNYKDAITISYYITSGIDIVDFQFVGYDPGVTDVFYSGQPMIPTYKVVNKSGIEIEYTAGYRYQSEDGQWLPSDDFITDLADSNLAKTGLKRLYVKGKGKYSSVPEVYKEYSISAVNMSEGSPYYDDFSLELDPADVFGSLESGYYTFYTGQPIEPHAILKYGAGGNPKYPLVEGVDYRVSYDADHTNKRNNVTVTVTALPNSNYEGSRSVTFSILAVDLNKAVVVGDVGGDGFSYTGQAIVPRIELKDGSNYTYVLKTSDYEVVEYYDVDKDKTLQKNAPKDVGNYKITIENKNSNIKGQTITLAYSIVKRDISLDPDGMFILEGVNGDNREIEWTGGKTDPKVICGTMVEGTDFDASYTNDDEPGAVSAAAVTITGKGNYTGQKTLHYTITNRSLANPNIKAEVMVNGGASTYQATITLIDEGIYANGHELQLASEYTIDSVTYITDKKDNHDYQGELNALPKAGEYKAILTGLGKYKDSKTVIIGCGYDISDAKVTIANPNASYTGNPVTPSGITLEYRDENGKKDSAYYKDGADSPFFIEFERDDDTPKKNANISAGEVFVVAVGNPAYGFYGTTTARAKFTITPLDIHSNKNAYEIKITDGRGNNINGTFTVPYINDDYKDIDFVVQDVATHSKELQYNIDYSVSFDGDCISQGTHYIYVTGKGNYTGTIKQKFAIGQTPIDHPDISLSWSGDLSSYAEGRPEPILTLGSYTLEKGPDKDYTYSVTPIASPASIGWNNCYKYVINGKNNFSKSRTEYYVMDLTQLDAATSLESWAPGQVYINRWRMDELLVDPEHIVQKRPEKFSLSYKKADGTIKTLELGAEGSDKDFWIKKYGSNEQPGTDGNDITLVGMNGYTGEVTFPVTLYTNIALAQFNTGSTITSGGSISLTQLQEAVQTEDGLKNLVSLKNLWEDETGGRIDPANYTVTFADSGYTPAIGTVDFIISGTQQAPRYYGGSMQISMTVTGALDGALVTAVIGDNNTVVYNGTAVTPGGVKYSVYDDKKLLKGVDEAAYLADANRDVTYADYDYVISFVDNTTIGLAQANIRGINKYSGTLTQPFKITYPFSKLTAQVYKDGEWVTYEGGLSFDYNTEADLNKPSVRLYYVPEGEETDQTEWERIDESLYKVDYDGYDHAGDAKIIITGPDEIAYKDILTGNGKTISYKLTTIPIAGTGSAIQLRMNRTPMYSGNSITATDLELLLTYKGYELQEGVDYRLQYYNNVNASTSESMGSVVINGMGNFSGSRTETFQILAMPISSQTDISVNVPDVIYTGSPEKPLMTIRQESGNPRTLLEGSDYEIKEYWDGANIHQQTEFTAVGSYYIVVEGKGNYSGTREIPYRIIERSMADGVEISFENSERCPIIDGVPNCVYDGKPHEPAVKVVYNGIVLKGPNQGATPDYLLSYTNNIDAGMATITITGNGSFNGTKTMEFRIQPRDIAGEDFRYYDEDYKDFVDEVNYPFDGNPVEPTIKVVDRGMPGSPELVRDTDYEVTFTDFNDDNNEHRYAGVVTLTVSGKGNYGGTKEFTYYIGEDISQSYTLVNGKSSVSVEYNGLVQAPAEDDITVVWGASTDLTDENGEKRYDIAFYKDGFERSNLVTSDQIENAGTYYVAVVGVPSKGTYAKSTVKNSCTYTINPRSIAPSYVLVSGYDGSYYYTGQKIEPKGITVEDTDLPVVNDVADYQRRTVKLINGVDYDLTYANNTAAGKASIIVTGKGNYTGNRVAYFNILSSDMDGNNTWDGTSEGTGSISNGSTTIAASDIILGFDNTAYNCMMYNGYERIPTVTINGVSNSEFIITASNNIRPGVATLTITGTGNNYTGTIIKNYTIKANLATYGMISAIADQVYTGYQITPQVTLTCGGNLLNQGSDYTVTYMNNTNVGRATVMASATSDSYYIGSATGSFNISNTAGGMEITGYGYAYTYTGYPIAPDVVVTMNGRVLNRGTDYTVTYSNNTNVGTATMTVTGIGSFSGTKTITYQIEAKNIENCLTTAVTNYQYTGSTYTPNVTVTDSSNGKTLVAGTDYTITYSNNTNPGTASITVTALSKNYTGSKVIPFKIVSAAVSGLRTSTIKNNSIKLAWTSQDYADGYQICNSNNRVVATTSKNSYTVKGLTSCTTYKFKVRSYVENADGSVSYGDFSTAVSAKTLLNTPTLKAKSTSKGKVTLTWTKVSKATGYEIYYSTKKNGIYTRLKTVSKSSARKYVDKGLASGEKYYYTIRAYRTSNGVKTYSNYNTIKSVKVK